TTLRCEPDRPTPPSGAPPIRWRPPPYIVRGPRKIAVAGDHGHLWGEQHRIETRTKRNHSRVNSGRLTIGGNYSRSPKDGPQACRLLILAAIYDGATRTEA